MVPPNNLGPYLAGKPVTKTLYRGMIRSLLYLTAIRHDIQFSTVLCARYQSNPNESHLIDVKRILRYLKDYACCNMDIKITSGAYQILGEKLVCWSTKKQQSVAMSSAEAEYVTADGCCFSIIWMKSQLSDYDIHYKIVPIFCDNTSTIAISNNPFLHSRTKHTNKREFWCTVTAYDPNPPIDDSEVHPLKKYLIKFSVINGKNPLTLTSKPLLNPLDLIMQKTHMCLIPPLRNGNYFFTEQVNLIQQLFTYCLLTGTKGNVHLTDKGLPSTVSDEGAAKTTLLLEGPRRNKDSEELKPLTDMEPHINPIVDPLGTDANDDEEVFAAKEGMNEDTQADEEATMDSLDKIATDIINLLKALTKVTETLKVIQDAVKDDSTLNKKVIEVTKAYTNNSINISKLLTLVKNFYFQGLKSLAEFIQATALKQEEHLALGSKSSNFMAWNLGIRMTFVESSQAKIRSKLFYLKQDTSDIKSMMTKIYQSFKGQSSTLSSSVPQTTLVITEGPITIWGENVTLVVTEKPLSHTEMETKDMKTQDTNKEKVEKEQVSKEPKHVVPISTAKPTKNFNT
nr:uncharacterized mitochondrial protein AtMg00810-like [Tanacetum cinerariifolium]